MKRYKLWKESFVPVLLILLVIFAVLLFVELKVNEETESSILIQIPLVVENVAEDDFLANEDFDSASQNSPDREEIFGYIAAKKWDEAKRFIRQKLEEKETSELLTYLAIVEAKQKNYEAAEALLTRAEAVKPMFSSFHFYKAVVLSKQGFIKEAIADYELQIEKVPYHFEAHYNLGLAQQKLKRYKQAIQTFEKTLQLAGGKRKAKTYYSLGKLLKAQGDKEGAEKAFIAAIRLQPDHVNARFGIASLHFGEQGGLEKAMAEYAKVLKLKPGYAPVYFQQGLAYSSFKKRKLSVRSYKKAIQLNPAYQVARYNLGLQLIRLKKWGEAKQQFMWILDRDPEHAKSYFNLARISSRQGDTEKALDYYKKALKVRGGNYPEALVNIGRMFTDELDYAQAYQAFNQAIKLEPENAKAWFNLGLAQLQAGETVAEESLRKALEYNPNLRKAWDVLAGIYIGKDLIEDAVFAYKQVLRLDEKDKDALFALADIYTQQGKYQDASNLYQEVLAEHPTYALVWEKLGRVYVLMQAYDDAESAFRQAIALDERVVGARRSLASLLLEQNRANEAIDIYISLVNENPSLATLRLEYAKALLAVRDITAAKDELEKGLRLEPDSQEMKELQDSL